MVFKVVKEMLKDRNYDVSDFEVVNDHVLFGDVEIFYFSESKVGVKTLKKLQELQPSTKKLIVIYNDVVTKVAKTILNNKTDFEHLSSIELFSEEELSFNVTKHDLVPKHILLSDEEKQEFLKEKKIQLAHMPIISKNDPVSKYFGAKREQVFKILRPSETCGIYETYRVVV